MPDLANAVAALDRIPDVLGVRYAWPGTTCIVRVLRDTPVVQEGIARVMARYRARYVIEVVPRSEEHIAAVERMTAEARAASERRGPRSNPKPAHVHRLPKGGKE